MKVKLWILQVIGSHNISVKNSNPLKVSVNAGTFNVSVDFFAGSDGLVIFLRASKKDNEGWESDTEETT